MRLRKLFVLTAVAAVSAGAQQVYAVDEPDATPRLVGNVQQASDSLYRLAKETLNRGDYRRAASMFERVYNRDARAALAADALYWQAFSLYRIGGGSELRDALESLTALTKSFPRASVLGEARQLRVRVCGALARQGNEECASEVQSLAADVERATNRSGQSSASSQERCSSDDEDERVAALNALLQMDSDRALPILEKVLARRDNCSAVLRRKAVFLVSQKDPAKSADILLNIAKNDPDSEVREQAVFWLGQVRGERAVDLLASLIQGQKDEAILKKAVFALSQHTSERAGTVIRDLALNESAPVDVRADAIFWLSQRRGSSMDVSALAGLYAKVGQQELKEKIIFSMSQMRSEAAGKFLVDLALNAREDTEMRKKAIFWVSQNRQASIEDIVGIYGKLGDDRELKEQLVFALSQRKESGALDKLMDIAKNDKDRDVRKRAVFWLGQSRDPRAVKFIEELISK